MSGNTKENRTYLKTQASRYMIRAGILLCLLFVAAFAIGSRAEEETIGYVGMIFAGAVFFLFTLGFLIKMTQSVAESLAYMERKLEKFSNGDFSAAEESVHLTEDFQKLEEYAELMRQNVDRQRKESDGEKETLLESIENLHGQMDRLKQQMTETSVSTEEIVDFMEKITAASDQIDQFSKEVQTSAEHTASWLKQSKEEIDAVFVRADGIRNEALKRRQIVKHSQLEVRDSFTRSLKAIQAIEEISGLAEKIMEIIEKTNMLSLNASIEAAKAGQAGNGFSVVADEIRKLADQSKKKMEEVQWIVSEAHFAVNNLKEDSNQLLHFIDSKIISDFDFFLDMADIYGNDAENMKNIVARLEEIYQELSSSMEGILGIADQIDEAAKIGFSNIQKLRNL